MVRVPAGTYRALYMKGPAVPVAAFSIDRDPVTRGEFLRWKGGGASAGADARRPMTDVTWREAGAFCKARGGRLPTLAEWEYVAAASRTERNAASRAEFMQEVAALYATRATRSASVDQAEVNAYGVRGMHGLVWEWVADPNDRIAALHHASMGHRHHHANGVSHDMSCAGAAIGASDSRDYPAFLRGAFRSGLTEASKLQSLGFRCAV
jgi:formylglycine-generating enzyme required for sulfatase activity